MREFVIIIWSILAVIFGFLLMYSVKRQKRQMGKYAMIYKLILVLLTFGISALTYYLLNESSHLVWGTRFIILLFGILNVWVMYKRPWTIRDPYRYEQDAFFPEFAFAATGGILMAIAFVSAPQFFEIIPYRVDVSRTLWDAPILYVLPFLIFKLTDISGQIPFRMVENPWVFPIEKVNPAQWPWRDLMQVNFQVKKSLLDEYNLFSWPARPWIEAPKEVSLGMVFQLCVNERRGRSDLSTIQDMGDEYDGTPLFCWLFSIKWVWYNPSTWFRKPRYLNPDLSISQNKIQKGDIIIAKRIPGDGTKSAGINYEGMVEEDTDKTVIINR